jgi:hypothetical protein
MDPENFIIIVSCTIDDFFRQSTGDRERRILAHLGRSALVCS